jgi:hypothetical protein
MNERDAAIPGLLHEKPLCGYTIEKNIGERGMRTLDRHRLLFPIPCAETPREPEPYCMLLHTAGEQAVRESVYDHGRGEQRMKAKVSFPLSRNQRIVSPFDPGRARLQLLSPTETTACLNERFRALDKAIEQSKAHYVQHEKCNETPFSPGTVRPCTRTPACRKEPGRNIHCGGEPACLDRYRVTIRP